MPASVEHALELGGLAHEEPVLLLGAVPHNAFDARPVVPRAVEQYDLPDRGQMLHVTLEIPLTLLALAGLFESNNGGPAVGSGAP